jgi:hypothetical protein
MSFAPVVASFQGPVQYIFLTPIPPPPPPHLYTALKSGQCSKLKSQNVLDQKETVKKHYLSLETYGTFENGITCLIISWL